MILPTTWFTGLLQLLVELRPILLISSRGDVVVIEKCFDYFEAPFSFLRFNVNELEACQLRDRVCSEVPEVTDDIDFVPNGTRQDLIETALY